MNVTDHAKKLATSFGAVDRANGKVVANLRDFINEASIGDALIANFLKEFEDNAKGKVKDSSLKVYKSQTKRILVLAKDHKQEVLTKASEAGNLNQWYQSCLDSTPAQRNQSPKVNKPKAKDLPKLQDEAKEPSEVTNPLDNFESAVESMLAAGMTAKEIHDKVDAIITLSTAQAA